MASNPKDQTQYASDSGDVPVAPKDQSIDRTNPYENIPNAQGVIPVQNIPNAQGMPTPTNAITIPTTTISGQPMDPRIADALGTGVPATGPMSSNDYMKHQIGSAESRKDTVAAEAGNLARGQDEIARINRQAEAEQRRMLFGNPEELLKAQEALKTAQAEIPKTGDRPIMNQPGMAVNMPGPTGAITPEVQAKIDAANQKIQENMGARPLLAKAMVDAENRDKALMAKINAAAAEQVDPDRWWNSKSTGGKILAGIGMVLGGAGGGLQGTGRNPALEVMNKAVDDDMAAQRHHIDNSWKAIATEHGLNTDAFNRELHRQTWEADFRKGAFENIKLQLGQAAATTQSETVKNNALNMIQTLSDEQSKIRNDQWKLGVQAQQAELNRMRALSKDADADVQKLMEKDGVSYQDAVDAVYSRPHFRGLVGAGMAPPEQAQKAMLRIQFSNELEKQKKQAALLGAAPGSDKYEKILDVVRKDPKFEGAFSQPGVVVPKDQKGAETTEQLLGRTVYTPGPNGTTVPKQAVNKKAADDYKEYNDAAPDVAKAQASLIQAWKDGDVGKYNAARGQLIDAMPKFMLGSGASGPTRAQAQETYGKLIPPYSHWYGYPGEGKEGGKFTPLGKALTDPQSRTDEAFGVLDQMIKGRKETMESSTFGAPAPKVANQGGPIREYNADGTPKK